MPSISFLHAYNIQHITGYAGNRCERCAYGHYGYPTVPGGSCIPCRCNTAGSASDECDIETGQCNCRPGSIGRDCSQCTQERHVLISLVCMCKYKVTIQPYQPTISLSLSMMDFKYFLWLHPMLDSTRMYD
jgi:hypothetical protein